MDERIQKYMQDELSPDERLGLLREIEKDDILRNEFIVLQNMKALLHVSSRLNNEDEAKEAYIRFINKVKRSKRRRLIKYSLAYAATISLIIVSTWWITTNFLSQTPPAFLADTNTLFVPAGQRAQITLQDGTKVWLNAKSTLTYPSHFFGKEREVSISGEAYFDVTKDENKPFIVHAQGNTIKVLGTKFNVYSYPDAEIAQTSLIEGAIEIYPGDSTDKIALKPNQQITIKDGKSTVSSIKNYESFSWKEGVYSFDNERLEDIVKKLELYYDVNIIISKNTLRDYKYTCKFRQREGINEILHLISRIHNFNIAIDRETNIITLS